MKVESKARASGWVPRACIRAAEADEDERGGIGEERKGEECRYVEGELIGVRV